MMFIDQQLAKFLVQTCKPVYAHDKQLCKMAARKLAKA